MIGDDEKHWLQFFSSSKNGRLASILAPAIQSKDEWQADQTGHVIRGSCDSAGEKNGFIYVSLERIKLIFVSDSIFMIV